MNDTDAVFDARLIRTAAVLMSTDKVREPICRVAVYVHDGHAIYAATDTYGLALVQGAGFWLTPAEMRAAVTGDPLFTLPAAEVKHLGKSVDVAKLEGEGDARVLRFGPVTLRPSWDVECYPRIVSLVPNAHVVKLDSAIAFQARRMADMKSMQRAIESPLPARMRGESPWRLAHAIGSRNPSMWTYAQQDCGGITFLLMPVRVA